MTEESPTVVAWEATRRCALRCAHCRGAARDEDYDHEFSTDEGRRFLDGLARTCTPLLILTGGEPLMRGDIFELAAHAGSLGMRVVMATCGHLLDAGVAKRLKEAGVQAVSISLDAPDAMAHDAFRGVEGAFENSLRAIELLREARIPFQINTTVTRQNVANMEAMLNLAIRLGARTLDFFFLVPTGRGAALHDLALPPAPYEQALQTLVRLATEAPIRIKTTCAPHMARLQAHAMDGPTPGRGCMGGRGFVFVSHTGILQPCGFLEVPCGDLRAADFDFGRLYLKSAVFNALRDPDQYRGKCGACEYRFTCGGCRARAFAATGDFLEEEPACDYVPEAWRLPNAPARGGTSR